MEAEGGRPPHAHETTESVVPMVQSYNQLYRGTASAAEEDRSKQKGMLWFTFAASIIAQVVTLLLSIIALAQATFPKNDDPWNAILFVLLLETIVQGIEFVWYAMVVAQFIQKEFGDPGDDHPSGHNGLCTGRRAPFAWSAPALLGPRRAATVQHSERAGGPADVLR